MKVSKKVKVRIGWSVVAIGLIGLLVMEQYILVGTLGITIVILEIITYRKKKKTTEV